MHDAAPPLQFLLNRRKPPRTLKGAKLCTSLLRCYDFHVAFAPQDLDTEMISSP